MSALQKAADESPQKGAEMTDSMIGIGTTAAYVVAAFIILIHVGFLLYCASRLSKTR